MHFSIFCKMQRKIIKIKIKYALKAFRKFTQKHTQSCRNDIYFIFYLFVFQITSFHVVFEVSSV